MSIEQQEFLEVSNTYAKTHTIEKIHGNTSVVKKNQTAVPAVCSKDFHYVLTEIKK